MTKVRYPGLCELHTFNDGEFVINFIIISIPDRDFTPYGMLLSMRNDPSPILFLPCEKESIPTDDCTFVDVT